MSARSGSGSSGYNDDDWKNISNEKERRKVQNRNAQRRHSMFFPLPSTPLGVIAYGRCLVRVMLLYPNDVHCSNQQPGSQMFYSITLAQARSIPASSSANALFRKQEASRGRGKDPNRRYSICRWFFLQDARPRRPRQ